VIPVVGGDVRVDVRGDDAVVVDIDEAGREIALGVVGVGIGAVFQQLVILAGLVTVERADSKLSPKRSAWMRSRTA
jgi:hypothetical protein